MNNMSRYQNIFVEAFAVEEEKVPALNYQDIDEWDSVGHMRLIAMLEETFDIMMDIDDIIDFSSFQKGIEVLAKYDVDIQ